MTTVENFIYSQKSTIMLLNIYRNSELVFLFFWKLLWITFWMFLLINTAYSNIKNFKVAVLQVWPEDITGPVTFATDHVKYKTNFHLVGLQTSLLSLVNLRQHEAYCTLGSIKSCEIQIKLLWKFKSNMVLCDTFDTQRYILPNYRVKHNSILTHQDGWGKRKALSPEHVEVIATHLDSSIFRRPAD